MDKHIFIPPHIRELKDRLQHLTFNMSVCEDVDRFMILSQQCEILEYRLECEDRRIEYISAYDLGGVDRNIRMVRAERVVDAWSAASSCVKRVVEAQKTSLSDQRVDRNMIIDSIPFEL